MKKLCFMMLALVGCAAELQTSENLGPPPEPEEILQPIGVIPADDCQHIDIGDKACNFRLLDQNGDVFDLYKHEGKVIVVVISAMWCGPCQAAGSKAQQTQEDYEDQGFIMVTVLIDGYIPGVEPTQQELQEWVTNHNATTSPVLLGSRDKMLDTLAIDGYSITGFPSFYYIDRDLKFYDGHSGYSEEYVRQIIEREL